MYAEYSKTAKKIDTKIIVVWSRGAITLLEACQKYKSKVIDTLILRCKGRELNTQAYFLGYLAYWIAFAKFLTQIISWEKHFKREFHFLKNFAAISWSNYVIMLTRQAGGKACDMTNVRLQNWNDTFFKRLTFMQFLLQHCNYCKITCHTQDENIDCFAKLPLSTSHTVLSWKRKEMWIIFKVFHCFVNGKKETCIMPIESKEWGNK